MADVIADTGPDTGTDQHAYRGSAELDRRTREVAQAQRLFDQQVVGAFCDQFPSTRPMWIRPPFTSALDHEAVGFEDAHPDQDPPVGLSRARGRGHLRPRRGVAGQTWREHLLALNLRPRLTPVWRALDVECGVLDFPRGVLRYPRVVLDLDHPDEGIWISYPVLAPERVSAHLTPIPTSEFYVAWERSNARRLAERASTGG